MQVKMILLLLLSFILAACGGGSPNPQPTPTPNPTPTTPLTLEQKIQNIDNFLANKNQLQQFNGAVLIAREHQALLMAAYGYTDHTKTTMLTTDSSFRLASVSKQFTCMAIMILQERGLLNYSDLLTSHIPELDYPNITIEHLMHHTAGIEDYTFFPESYIQEQNSAFMTMPVFFAIVADYPLDLQFTLGSEWSYSNTGYILLAEIVARVSGKTFEDFLHDEIFVPLNMNDSDVWNLLSDPQTDRLPNRTFGFAGDQDRSSSYFDGVAGDGAVFASVADLLKWDQALHNNSLVSAETINKAYTPAMLDSQSTDYANGYGYGYGWLVGSANGQDYAWHSGSWLGARTFIYRNLTNQSLVVLLDNSSNTDYGILLDYMVEQLEDENFF